MPHAVRQFLDKAERRYWQVASLRVLGRDLHRLILFCLTLATPGCGDPATVLAKSITGGEQTLISLDDGLVKFDKAHQAAIVEGATTRPDAVSRLHLYRQTRDKVVAGMLEGQRLLVVAKGLLLAAVAGASGDLTAVAQAVADLVAAVTKAVAAFAALQAPAASGP